MNTISFSAPGKVHLMGEHSVVYGKPALLSAINKRVIVTVSERKANENFPLELKTVIEESLRTHFGITKFPEYFTNISSSIPVGMGLGSSAAMSAAFTACLLTFLEIKFDNTLLFKIAYEGEKLFHGNPSGGDLAVSIEGGLLYYRKEFEFLKSFSHLPFSISKHIKPFVIINSGKPAESTLEMVKKVGEQINENPKATNEIFNDQELQTKNLVLSLKEGDKDLLISSIKKGELNLEKLNVVGKSAMKIIREIENTGGAAKISGGGGIKNGSGMLLCYHTDPQILLDIASKNKLESEIITTDERGIFQE